VNSSDRRLQYQSDQQLDSHQRSSSSWAAAHLGLKMVGTVGILLRAKEQQLIERVEPYLQALRTKAHFWLSDDLYNHALISAGER
jgi:predicted nucleic acid-binding protein